MKQGLSLLLSLGCCTSIFLDSATAQVTPDGTTNTTVDVSGNDFTIEQGDRAGGNLFHSFGEFSVPTDGSAFFNNAADIVNIFSRVTGGNISNIDGLLGANGAANLFLINPAGIIFGEGARLDIGGSFYGSTADSIVFPDGEFSATDLTNPPLLTINAPIGLNFRDNTSDIVNRSLAQDDTGDFVGLKVISGQNLTLVGGNINFETGQATARGGNIELGGLSQTGTVTLNDDGSLSFPNDVTKADITLNNAADVDVRGTGGGSITINTRNLSLEAGDFGSSSIRAGITADSTSPEAQAGDIRINADNINADNSPMLNQVISGAVGNAGDVIITTGSLTLTNGGEVSASTFGQGNAGSVNITASDTITFDGERSVGAPSGATSQVALEAVGDSGGVIITTGSLTLTNGGQVDASTLGQGNAGAVKITASDTITFDGDTFDGESSQVFPSGTTSQVGPGAVGDSGGVTIITDFLTLTNGGRVGASTFGQGNAGVVSITASDTITFDGEQSGGIPSGATSQVAPVAMGDSGGVTITTSSLTLTNGGQISASTFGQGNAGAVNITASDTITFDGENSQGTPGGAFSRVNSGAEGDAVGVTITTGSLALTNGGTVDASTLGQGNAGSVNITASNTIALDGGSIEAGNFDSLGVSEPGTGEPGNITIQTNSLSLTNGARINAATQSETGNTANINLQLTEDLTLRDNSFISARALENANGGNLNINSRFILGFPSQGNGNDIIATAERGIGGNITIISRQIFNLQEGRAIDNNGNFFPNNSNDIDASSQAEGLDGTVTIFNPDTNTLSTDVEIPSNLTESEQTYAQACQSAQTSDQPSGLTVKGKGGVPPAPIEPFASDPILVDEQINPRKLQARYPEIKPIKTSMGDIYPARGVIKTDDGKIILTAYATDNLNTRTPHISADCNSVSQQ